MFWFTAGRVRTSTSPRRSRDNRACCSADVTFGPYDAIIEVEAQDLSRLGKIVYSTIRPQPGVIDTLTCLAVE